MREIRFRAWDKSEKKMIDSSEFIVWDLLCDFHESNFKDDGYVFMQSTGLKDKNGVEIFEGDVVEYKYITRCDETESGKRTVEYDEYQCGFSPFCYQTDVDDCWYNYLIKNESIEVIGNIHENPELLEEK